LAKQMRVDHSAPIRETQLKIAVEKFQTRVLRAPRIGTMELVADSGRSEGYEMKRARPKPTRLKVYNPIDDGHGPVLADRAARCYKRRSSNTILWRGHGRPACPQPLDGYDIVRW